MLKKEKISFFEALSWEWSPPFLFCFVSLEDLSNMSDCLDPEK